jgi:hypothetical protein
MRGFLLVGCLVFSGLVGCREPAGTEPPPGGWANNAPTVVVQVVDTDAFQLLEVRQGELRTWIRVPRVGAEVGDYVLLGQGEARFDIEIPGLDRPAPAVVDIQHVRVVDLETARRAVGSPAPKDAVPVGTVYAELDERADQEIVVFGTVVKASNAIGWYWVHLQDGTGNPSIGTNDLTVKTSQFVTEGQRVAFRGILRQDVDLGFGYHYEALVESGQLVE